MLHYARVRVGIRLNFSPGRSGGVEQYTHGLAHGLGGLDGDDEYVFAGWPAHRAAIDPYLHGPVRWMSVDGPHTGRWGGVRARLLDSSLGRVAAKAKEAARPSGARPVDADLEARCDVLHFPTQGYEQTVRPSLYQPWDLQHRSFPEFFAPDVITRRERRYSEACRACTYVVVASHFTKGQLVDAYDVAPEKIAVIVPGAPATLVEPDVAAPEIESPYALYPAQPWPHKNHLRLVEAIAMLERDGVSVPVICPGQPNAHAAAVRGLARDLGVDAHFTFPGYVSPSELAALLRGARLLIFPSLFEGFGFPVLEAFAAGTPVACSNTTSLPELAAGAALMFDPTDVGAIAASIDALWRQEQQRAELIRLGRDRARGYSWDSLALSCRALYRSCARSALTAEDAERLVAAGVQV